MNKWTLFLLMHPLAASALSFAQIKIEEASYGHNCGVPPGNQTLSLGNACNGREICRYRINIVTLGNPVAGCAKEYKATWSCADGSRFTATAFAEASGKTLEISCAAKISIISATYGENCGATSGNQTDTLGRACNLRSTCDYRVNLQVIGDPAPTCAKNYVVRWACDGTEQNSETLLPEASGKELNLTCL